MKGPLQSTMVDEQYAKQNYKDLPDQIETGSYEKVTREQKGATAKKNLLDDAPTGF